MVFGKYEYVFQGFIFSLLCSFFLLSSLKGRQLTGLVNNGCEYDLLVGEWECRERGSCRIGLEGADGWGLCPPSLSLDALLGGVGGIIRLSTLTEKDSKSRSKQVPLKLPTATKTKVVKNRSKQVPSEYHITPKVRCDNGSVVDKIRHKIKLEFHKQTLYL